MKKVVFALACVMFLGCGSFALANTQTKETKPSAKTASTKTAAPADGAKKPGKKHHSKHPAKKTESTGETKPASQR